MGFYDSEGKRRMHGVRLTNFQGEKLKRMCDLFGVSEQRILSDYVDALYANYLEVASGKISVNGVVKNSAQKVLDDYAGLDKIKGLVHPQYPDRQCPPTRS